MNGPVYFAEPAAARVAVALETLVAIFHEPSGMTHLLAAPAPEILGALTSGPADIDTLVERLSADHVFDPTQAAASIRARLDELEAGGLVRRA